MIFRCVLMASRSQILKRACTMVAAAPASVGVQNRSLWRIYIARGSRTVAAPTSDDIETSQTAAAGAAAGVIADDILAKKSKARKEKRKMLGNAANNKLGSNGGKEVEGSKAAHGVIDDDILAKMSKARKEKRKMFGNAANNKLGSNGGKEVEGSKYFAKDTITSVAACIGPSVVQLDIPKGFYGNTSDESQGSGFFIDTVGTIITCARVVVNPYNKLPSKKVIVTLDDGRIFKAKVAEYDMDLDIAIVKLNPVGNIFQPVKFGASSLVRPGDWAISFGSPRRLHRSVTVGIISCIDRSSSEMDFDGPPRLFLQTDCPLNIGSFGGPLVDINGRVIGLNHWVLLNEQGMLEQGYALSIPIDSVCQFLKISQFCNKRDNGANNPFGTKISQFCNKRDNDANNTFGTFGTKFLAKDTFASVAACIGPSVVQLYIPKGYYGNTTKDSTGSGFFIDTVGTILTCAHVVINPSKVPQSSKKRVQVTLSDGRIFNGKVTEYDIELDMAVVKINLAENTTSSPVKFGASSKVRSGDWAICFGSPLGYPRTVSIGNISCIRISSDVGIPGKPRLCFQTDCSTNRGNSGGPVVDLDGQVIGLHFYGTFNELNYGEQGFGFCIQSDILCKFISASGNV